MIDRMLRTPCTIRHRGSSGVDEYGNPTQVESGTTDTVCWLDPARSVEVTNGQQTYIQDWTLYLPAGTTIDGGDQVEVDGVLYELTGNPRRFTRPTSTVEHHVECDVRRVS